MNRHECPFAVEYAKSNRSGCRFCNSKIAKDALRMAIMVQSPHFDGRQPLWYHFDCFWAQSKADQVQSEEEIYHFDILRWDDQEKIRERMKSGGKSRISLGGGVKPVAKANITDFEIEYSKNASAKCRECGNKILKKELRIGRGGKPMMWYHLSCFSMKRQEFGFIFDPQNISGFDSLTEEDKNLVQDKLKSMKRGNEIGNNGQGGPATKKARKDGVNAQAAVDPVKIVLKKQSEDLWTLRDQLKGNLTKKQWSELLSFNDQTVPSGEDKILDRLTDCMLFGALEPCVECGGGQQVYSSSNNSYVCTGHVSGFTSCQYTTQAPKRVVFNIPEEMKDDNEFLSDFVFVPGRERVFPVGRVATPSSKAASSSSSTSTASLSAPSKPLLHLKFAFLPNVGNEVREKMRESGAVMVSKIDDCTVAVVAPKSTLKFVGQKSDGKEVVAAKEADIQVVSEEFVDDAIKLGVAAAIDKFKLCDWGSDVHSRVVKCRSSFDATKSGTKSRFMTKSMPAIQKVVVKGGAAVDPEFEFAAVSHIYQDNQKNVYNAILGRVDVQIGHNSYYKLQLIEHDSAKKYWIYRAWGRIGTSSGGTKVDSFGASLEDAKDEFMKLYEERTGNEWQERHNFVKRPHMYYPMDIDYGQEEEHTNKVKAGSQSVLPRAVQDLVKLIFDIEQMKETMKEFSIDMAKMPLGKLSKKQIQSAYSVLTELQNVLQGDKNRTKIVDCTNRFFTLIPHDFGLSKPPLLDDIATVKAKTEMLDSLLEIEVAYSILKGDTGDRDPIDVHYEKLRTDLEILDKSSKEFQMIQEYVTNTHAATHQQFKLVVEEVFVTNRHGEKECYAQFKDLHNRMLLWHGSRTTNYAGILSQGLRIAPPEAPVTGYMFGKGVYFADMVSKSANYCYPSPTNPTGLILLCEVALGNMQELKNAKDVTKLPAGIHSVKGVGRTAPNPGQTITLDDGTVVPLGKGATTNIKETSLLYNEYIVYNVSQVNIKYMLKLRFDYKYPS